MAMDVLVPKLQTKNLRRAPDAAAYQLYRAAQEWDVEPNTSRRRELCGRTPTSASWS
jgi:hypothetical protein